MHSENTYNSANSTGSEEPDNDLTLEELLASRKWGKYFDDLSRTLNIELSGYDVDGFQLFSVNENPLCKFVRSVQTDLFDCPGSCHKFLTSDESHIYKCQSNVICFSIPVRRLKEKAFIVGRGGFASYDDLLTFLGIIRDNNLPALPVSMPLDFLEEDSAEVMRKYIQTALNMQLNSVEARYKLEEKLLRMTSLFDSQAFVTLSKNPQLMYRYLLDTIEFVFGSTSAALMVPGEDASTYSTTYSIGKYKDVVSGLTLAADNHVITKINDTKSAVFFKDLEEVLPADQFRGIDSMYCIPVITGSSISSVIVIFNRDLSREDKKILSAFREYVQVNLENHSLRSVISRNRSADRKLSYVSDITKSIVSILDKERLIHTLLEKSLQLTGAEQGSFMLMDNDTSELVVEARRSADDMVQEKMRLKMKEGISGMVLESGDPLLVEDIEKDPRIKKVNRPRYRTKSFVSVPIKIEDRLAGVLNLSDKIKGDAFDQHDLNIIEAFLSNVAIAIERSILHKQTETLQKLSITDPLTGIYNRRYLNRRLSEEITRYNRYKHHFSFMMLDLDKFKQYNDTFGHIAGDNLIKNLGSIMEKSLRTIDIAARFGGDEFVAIFPQTPKGDAIQISNRLKEKIDWSLREHNPEMPLSVSVGLATFPDDASSIMELIEKTDQALYLAKKGGGNRVVYL
jgi:diguanylate cyclase (GGDEF)-like protein